MPKWDPPERMVRGLRAEGAGFKPSVPHIINGAEIRGFCAAVPEVRIHLPPAESPQTFGSSAGFGANAVEEQGCCPGVRVIRCALISAGRGFQALCHG